MAYQSSSPPSTSPKSPTLPHPGLDHISIPYDLDALARPDGNGQANHHTATTTTITDDDHPYGVLNSVHIRLLQGRDTHRTNAMQPAMPALITRRDDFPAARAGGSSSSDDTTAATTAPNLDRAELMDYVHRVMTPTFPPRLEGVVETRHRSDAKMTESLRGLAGELEAAVGSKRASYAGFRAFRAGFGALEDALAARAARELRGARAPLAEHIRELHRRRDRYPGDYYDQAMGDGAARLGEIQRGIRALAVHMGLMFACGRAVDMGVFPGKDFEDFDEAACSPKTYLSSILPDLVRRAAPHPVDPAMPDLLPPDLHRLLYPDWDFSLAELMPGARRAALRSLWEAALAGDWRAVEDKTRGGMAVAGALLAAGTHGGGGGGS
ncbi:hypothetical protein VPNG_04174 [Cytospora leucostoma]|uniref:Uncharacterized protein n=1 Tax=Cytospora leucostoma TaxID=1230097 RepID=A0A423XD78_9PEZI|nr:hypothetical protein VPNG_04174 [Cytospora leucostoma]